MSSKDAARKLREKFRMGPPPAAEAAGSPLLAGDARPRRPGRRRKAETIVQLNLRVPEEVKDRVRLLAARDRKELSEIVMVAIDLYEARFGAVPILKPSPASK